MCDEGEITKGGGGADLSEYFEMTPITMSPVSSWAINNYMKKFSTLTIPNGVTSLNGLFTSWRYAVAPTVYCTNSVVSLNYMFGESSEAMASKVENVDLSHLNTSNVTQMQYMFQYCSRLKNVNIDNWDLGKLQNAQYMFARCTSIQSLDLSNMNPTALTNTTNMFNNCTSLTFLDIRQFTLSSITTFTNMFGAGDYNGPPDNCLIVVKDATEKTWITSKFSRLTNVKTVSEYEGS